MKHVEQVIALIESKPEGASITEIAAHIGLTLSGAAWRMKQLRLAGVAINTARGRGSRWVLVARR